MVMWQKTLDPFVTVISTDSPSMAAILLKMPGSCISAHVAIYLPTAGQEAQFVSALASLDNCLEELLDQYDDLQIFIRGDANVNPKNRSRSSLLEHFLSKFSLLKAQTGHPTYHHFMGMGIFDSQLDVILHPNSPHSSETVTEVVCKFDNPLVQSHHDLILSTFSLSPTHSQPKNSLPEAPRVDNERVRIVWSDEGISQYEEMVGDNLSRLRDTWCNPSSPASMSVLLQSTYGLLSSAAKSTNKAIHLSDPSKPKPRHHPNIVKLQKNLLSRYKALASLRAQPVPDIPAISELDDEYLKLKASYLYEIKQEQRQDSIERDSKLQTVLSSNPSAIFSTIKALKNSSSSKISSLNVVRLSL